MTIEEVQEGTRAIFDEILAVATMEITEDRMTMPMEFEELIHVGLGHEAPWEGWNPVVVLHFGDGSVFKIQVCKTK